MGVGLRRSRVLCLPQCPTCDTSGHGVSCTCCCADQCRRLQRGVPQPARMLRSLLVLLVEFDGQSRSAPTKNVCSFPLSPRPLSAQYGYMLAGRCYCVFLQVVAKHLFSSDLEQNRLITLFTLFTQKGEHFSFFLALRAAMGILVASFVNPRRRFHKNVNSDTNYHLSRGSSITTGLSGQPTNWKGPGNNPRRLPSKLVSRVRQPKYRMQIDERCDRDSIAF